MHRARTHARRFSLTWTLTLKFFDWKKIETFILTSVQLADCRIFMNLVRSHMSYVPFLWLNRSGLRMNQTKVYYWNSFYTSGYTSGGVLTKKVRSTVSSPHPRPRSLCSPTPSHWLVYSLWQQTECQSESYTHNLSWHTVHLSHTHTHQTVRSRTLGTTTVVCQTHPRENKPPSSTNSSTKERTVKLLQAFIRKFLFV
jgi:hypothetical protein